METIKIKQQQQPANIYWTQLHIGNWGGKTLGKSPEGYLRIQTLVKFLIFSQVFKTSGHSFSDRKNGEILENQN